MTPVGCIIAAEFSVCCWAVILRKSNVNREAACVAFLLPQTLLGHDSMLSASYAIARLSSVRHTGGSVKKRL